MLINSSSYLPPFPGFVWHIQCAVTAIQKAVITSFGMGVTAHWMGQTNPGSCAGTGRNICSQIQVPDCISRHVSAFVEVFIFQWSLPLMVILSLSLETVVYKIQKMHHVPNSIIFILYVFICAVSNHITSLGNILVTLHCRLGYFSPRRGCACRFLKFCMGF